MNVERGLPSPPDRQWLPSSLSRGTGLRWHCRTPAQPTLPADTQAKTRELLRASCSVLQRDDLSPDAQQLFRLLRAEDAYVVCIDPRAVATQVGGDERQLQGCFRELARAGVISGRLGNLVFFA